MSNILRVDAFTGKCLLDLDQDVALYPLQHVTYAVQSLKLQRPIV